MLHPLTIDTALPPDTCHPEYDPTVAAVGLCPWCGAEHTLATGLARAECRSLMQELERNGRIDLAVTEEYADPRLSLDYLHGVARGQMFGVLVCRTQQGTYGTLRAFSAQYNRIWHVDGWVPPLLDIAAFDTVVAKDDPDINRMGREIRALDERIAACPSPAPGEDGPAAALQEERARLTETRRLRSRQSMHDIHALYRVRNFKGDSASLFDIFPAGRGIPTGTGDCCAPKLLQYAALHHLTPLGLAEFYWGRESRSGARRHGQFYPSCQEKCYPILGHMLCGMPHP